MLDKLRSMQHSVMRYLAKHRRELRIVKWAAWLINLAAGVIVVVKIIPAIMALPVSGIFSGSHLLYGSLAVLSSSTFAFGTLYVAKARKFSGHRAEHEALKQSHGTAVDEKSTLSVKLAELAEQNAALSAANAELLERNKTLQAEKNDACRALATTRKCIERFSQNERVSAELAKQRMAHLNPLVLSTRHRAESLERGIAVIDFDVRQQLLTLRDILNVSTKQSVVAYVTAMRRLGDGPEVTKDAMVEILYFEPSTGLGLNYLGEFSINAETSTMDILRFGRQSWLSNDLKSVQKYRNDALPQLAQVINAKCAVPIAVGAMGKDAVAMLTVDAGSGAEFDGETLGTLELFAHKLAPLLYNARALALMREKLTRRDPTSESPSA